MAQSKNQITWLVDLRGFESMDLLHVHNPGLLGRSATGLLPVDRNDRVITLIGVIKGRL